MPAPMANDPLGWWIGRIAQASDRLVETSIAIRCDLTGVRFEADAVNEAEIDCRGAHRPDMPY